ncbi:MAG: TIGR03086 family metal-binding protein [Actinocatenispora sp.]
MDTMESYRLAQDGLDAVLAAVRPDQWDTRSACAEWTVRDVAGHVIWGQYQMRAWATGEDYAEAGGAPGSPQPGRLADGDPLTTWREARSASVAALTDEALARPTAVPGFGEVPLAAMVTVLTMDQLTHTWDVGHALGLDVRLEPSLVPVVFDWARANVVRRPGFFGPEVTPPADADEQTRMLAYLGRAAWLPVPV